MVNIAVLASGRGTNFAAILRAVKKGRIAANLALLVCDNPKAAVLSKGKRAGIKTALVKRGEFPSKQEFEQKIIRLLKEEQVDLVVLAGFMRLLSPEFVREFKNRIMNIHPSLLPSFKGTTAIKDAFEYAVKVTGVTVHFVDEELDHGPIILQEAVKIEGNDTLESLEAKIHKVEHKLYPRAIQLFILGRLKTESRRVETS